ncbi:MAG: TraB/GumN family protein [Pseudomonadota bacterium]
MRFRSPVSSLLFAACLAVAAVPASAQTPPPSPAPAEDGLQEVQAPSDLQDIDAIVVSGRFAGPGLWKVRNGQRVLWILGTQSPLPKRMEWESSNVERRIAESQELLMPPSVDLDIEVGFFRGLTLLPSAFKARKNPDGKTLQDIVPPAQYARWQALKKRYIGGDRGIEEWRPVFAALELYNKAIERSGMTQDSLASDVARKAAKRAKVKITTPQIKLKITDPKGALRDFSSETFNDLECFRRTLDRIEGDLGTMVGRANAWAEGDIETLRNLPYRTQLTGCRDALTDTAFARKQGMHDIQSRLENVWLSAAEKSLRENDSTFAVLPVGELLGADGLLQRLVAKGYAVEEP